MYNRRAAHLCTTNEDQYLPGPTEDRSHEGCTGHTPSPDGYVAWHLWAEAMAKTHRQTRCPECRLYSIWVPKAARHG